MPNDPDDDQPAETCNCTIMPGTGERVPSPYCPVHKGN
jgi:hypothetical protein